MKLSEVRTWWLLYLSY